MSEKPALRLNQSLFGSSMSRFLPLGVFVVLFVFFSIFANNFFTVRNVLNLLVQASTFVILSIGAALVLIVGGVDFSSGAEIALSGTALFVFAMMGFPVWLSMIFAVIVSGLIGLVNGLLVARMRLPSFITTLGISILLYGFLGLIWSLGNSKSGSYLMPEGIDDLANTPVFAIVSHDATGALVEIFPGISWIVIIMVIVAVFFHLVLTKTRIGRYLYLAGSNENASRLLSGINIVGVKILAFVLGGLLAGLSGVLLTSRLGGPPGGAVGYEVIGIASAMIGGASLFGGSGRIGGTVVGALLLSTISMGLTMMNTKNAYLSMLLNGFIILCTVYLEQIRTRRETISRSGGTHMKLTNVDPTGAEKISSR